MSKTTILIVEDETLVAENLSGRLANLGYEVAGIAARAEEAVALAGRLRPNLVLMDIWLEGPTDGIEAAEVIRQQHDIPVIYLTAHSDPATLARAKVSGPFGYILKPFEQRELATQIELALYKHQADRELVEGRQRLAGIVGSAMDAIVSADAHQRIILFNAAAEKMFCCSAAEAIGQPLDRFIPERFRAAHAGHVKAFGESGITSHVMNPVPSLRALRADGEEFPMEASISQVVVGGQEVFTVILRDITERKRAEQALIESEAKFRQLANSIPQLAWIARPDGWTFWYNDRWYEYTGTTPEQMEGWGWQSVHDPRELLQVMERWKASIATGQPFEMEFPLRAADGRFRWFLTRVMPFRDPEGRMVLWFGTSTDITTQREVAEHLQRARAVAEAANVAKSHFLANISHELRTPLNSILGMVDLALPKQVDRTVAEFLKTAKDSADLLLVLLNDLVDCAKIEFGELHLESLPFSLRPALDQITRVLTARADEKGINFSCRIAPEVPDALVGDRVRLQQVLLNLGGNGIKFTERGEVAVAVSVESQDAAQVCLAFAVRDTGIGISAAESERLFQPFAQADPSTTRRFGGAGLGLSIASSLVGLMGGRISVESQPQQGSTFRFAIRLPLAKQQLLVRETPGTRFSATSSLRILLVEDNPANQKFATFMLKERGHEVDIAGDGQQGCGMAQQNQYDVILMDVQMPVMDGLEATKAIRAWEEGRSRVPIVAVTAHAMKEDRERCLAAGMDGYLSKPIDAGEMFAMLDRVAAKATLLAPAPPPQPATAAAVPIFDSALALKRCMDSQDMLGEMVQCFQEEVDSLLPRMKTALQAGNYAELGRLGHRLKGTIVYLGAEPATEAAQRVAHFSQHPGDRDEVQKAVQGLERECALLKSALSAPSAVALR
jgi:PAS domain S-box-containing protein